MKLHLIFAVFIFKAFAEKGGFDAFEFQQHVAAVKAERFEVVRFNSVFMKQAKVVTFKYNRTVAARNFTFSFNVDLDDKSEVIAQWYKFMSNEYRFYPVRFQINSCDAIKLNTVGVGTFLKCGNFQGSAVKKNMQYAVCNWTINERKFPPLIPERRYRVELQFLFQQQQVLLFDVYLSINYPLIGKNM